MSLSNVAHSLSSVKQTVSRRTSQRFRCVGLWRSGSRGILYVCRRTGSRSERGFRLSGLLLKFRIPQSPPIVVHVSPGDPAGSSYCRWFNMKIFKVNQVAATINQLLLLHEPVGYFNGREFTISSFLCPTLCWEHVGPRGSSRSPLLPCKG